MNKKKAKTAFLAAILCLEGSVLFTDGAGAAEVRLPSLFCNDEAWYKDTVSPLILRDGEYYIPADLFSMFDYISVTVPKDNNLLIHNTDSGEYISILFDGQSAAVNGDIVEDVGIFRYDGIYYVNADLACEAVGLMNEYYTSENGDVSLRITDEDKILTLEELIGGYLPDEEELFAEEDREEDTVKRIYLLCSSPDGKQLTFPARDNLEFYGLEYTLFLNSSSSADTILSSLANGEYGLEADGAESLDKLNEKIFTYSRRISRLTLSTGDDSADKALRDAGYCTITPDFTVNGGTYADEMLPDIINYLGEHESCTVYLEDCWSSQRMMVLIDEMDYKNYVTSNLTDIN